MRHHYTRSLGLDTVSPALRPRDEMLRRTGDAATKLIAQVNKLPKGQRPEALRRALTSLTSELPARVEKVRGFIRKTRGWSNERALHEALTLAMADALLEQIQELGRQKMAGYRPVLGRVRSLGGLGDQAGQVVENLARGVACSRGLQTSMSDVAGRNQGTDAASATSVGFEVARAFATCPETPTAVPLPPPPPPASDSSNIIVPVVIGAGVLAVLGTVIWITKKK